MFKRIGKIILLVLIFAAGAAAGLVVKYYIDDWRAKRNVALWMESFEAPYKNDKYGGKTPEETFDLYLAALKKGDLELASRYFWVDKQKGELEYLEKIKKNGTLQDYINRLDAAKNSWQPVEDTFYNNGKDRIAMEYSYILSQDRIIELPDLSDPNKTTKQVIKAGTYKNIIQFVKNIDIWKLYN